MSMDVFTYLQPPAPTTVLSYLGCHATPGVESGMSLADKDPESMTATVSHVGVAFCFHGT